MQSIKKSNIHVAERTVPFTCMFVTHAWYYVMNYSNLSTNQNYWPLSIRNINQFAQEHSILNELYKQVWRGEVVCFLFLYEKRYLRSGWWMGKKWNLLRGNSNNIHIIKRTLLTYNEKRLETDSDIRSTLKHFLVHCVYHENTATQFHSLVSFTTANHTEHLLTNFLYAFD